MDEVVGDQDVFVEGSVVQIMERARKAMMEETNAKLAKEREARILAEGRLLEERSKHQKEVEELRTAANNDSAQSHNKIRGRVVLSVKALTIGIHIAAMVLVSLATLSTSRFAGKDLADPKNDILRWGLFSLQAVLLVVGIANLHFGFMLSVPIKTFEKKMTETIERWLLG
jgi:hypothetical protein